MNLSLSTEQEMDLRNPLDKVEKQQTALAAEISAAERQLTIAEGMIERYRQLASESLIS